MMPLSMLKYCLRGQKKDTPGLTLLFALKVRGTTQTRKPQASGSDPEGV
jgi:hypothetical protein